jgi:hypothetical protein
MLQNNVLFKTHDNFNIKRTVCITQSYIQRDIVIVFTMAFKCVLKAVNTYVYYTRLQEENHFCSKKMLTSRKLTGEEIL